jgi:hypothetical protein
MKTTLFIQNVFMKTFPKAFLSKPIAKSSL